MSQETVTADPSQSYEHVFFVRVSQSGRKRLVVFALRSVRVEFFVDEVGLGRVFPCPLLHAYSCGLRTVQRRQCHRDTVSLTRRGMPLGCTWSVSSCSEPGLNPCHLRGPKKAFFRFLFFCSSEGKSVLVPVITFVSCASVRMRPQLASGSRTVCRKCDRLSCHGNIA